MLSALSGRMRRRDEAERQGQSEGEMGLGERQSQKNSGWREKWNACQSTRESHQSTVLRHTHTLSDTNSAAVCPRRARGDRYSSHCNYLSLLPLSTPTSVSPTNTLKDTYTQNILFFSVMFGLIISHTVSLHFSEVKI